MKYLPELKTRLEKTDVQLDKDGLFVKDKSKVLVEVDKKESYFNSRNYKVLNNELKRDLENKYANYLLINSKRYFLAIVSSKRKTKIKSMLNKNELNSIILT